MDMSDFINQVVSLALIHLSLGFGFALLNLVVRYFVPRVPQVISIAYWGLKPRVFVLAYLIAFVFELVTSPLYRALGTSAYVELGLSFYEALFNVLGILLMDLIIYLWRGTRRGVDAG